MARLKVLLNINSNTFFPELHRVALLLRDSGKYEPMLMFGWDYATMPRDITTCLGEGLTCLDIDGGIIKKPRAGSNEAPAVKVPRRGAIKRAFRRLPESWQNKVKPLYHRIQNSWFAFSLVFHGFKYWRYRMRLAREIFRSYQPSLLIIGGDLVHYDTAAFVHVAHEYGVQALIVPTTMSDQLEMAESYLNSPKHDYRNGLNRVLGWVYPQWVYEHKGKKLVREPAYLALPMQWLGLAPKDPWIMQSGASDAIAVESDAMIAYYRKGGIPAEKLVSTGSPINDHIAHAALNAASLRQELYRELGLPADRPMILTALPPDQHYLPGGRPECEFASHADIVRFWIDSLKKVPGYNIVVSLHPSVHIEEWRHIESDRVKISTRPTGQLIPLCDLFVASVSSVIRWAIAAGKPTLNYDVYKFRYDDYRNVTGVITTESRIEYLKMLALLTTNPEALEGTASKQRSHAAHWGLLDGKASERIIQLVDSMAASHNKRILDLGCGHSKTRSAIGVDRVALPGVDVVADISDPRLPFADHSFDEIYLNDIIEHLPNTIATMEAIYRVAKPDAKIFIRVVNWNSHYAAMDPTHVRSFTENSFDFFGKHSRSYYSHARFDVVSCRLQYNTGVEKFWLGNQRILKFLSRYLCNVLEGLNFELKTVKTNVNPKDLPATDGNWQSLLRCPHCASLRIRNQGVRQGELRRVTDGWLTCAEENCQRKYPVSNGTPILLPNEGAQWSRMDDDELSRVLPTEIARILPQQSTH